MATREEIVQDMLGEYGRQDSAARAHFDNFAGAVTVDLLSQSGGRFPELVDEKEISIDVTNLSYKLPSNFGAAQEKSIMLTSAGAYSSEFYLVSQNEFYIRQADTATYPGYTYGYIKKLERNDTLARSGAGLYLIIGGLPAAAYTMRFLYYRRATINDTDLIINVEAVKEGIRGRAKKYNPDWQLNLEIYFRMRSGFKPSVRRKSPNLSMRPSEDTENFNEVMDSIGGGG